MDRERLGKTIAAPGLQRHASVLGHTKLPSIRALGLFKSMSKLCKCRR